MLNLRTYQHSPLQTLLILLIFTFSFFQASLCHADIWSGLVGWWKFDESSSGTCAGATVVDANNHGHTGTCSGSPTYEKGRIGRGAMNYQGTNNVNLGTSLPLTGLFSVSAWVKPTSACLAPTQGCGFVGNAEWNVGGFHLGWYSSDVFDFAWNYSGSNIVLGVKTSSYFSANTWAHVVGVFDGSHNYVYINGILAMSGVASIAPGSTSNNLFIGKDPQGGWSSPQFSGSIDDVRIYNRALSAADVSMLYLYGTVTLRNSTWRNFKTY